MSTKLLREKVMKAILFTCAIFSIVIVAVIIGYMGWQSSGPLFGWLAYGFGNSAYINVVPYFFTTFYVSLGAAALALIVGIPCSIYLSEFANIKLRNIIKPTLEVLTGFPSVIMGLLVYSIVCISLIQRYASPANLCIMAGWIVLGMICLPLVVSVSEDSIRAVPHDLREASFGLGATRWQTVTKVLIPSSLSGISSAILLAILEAMGETMAVTMVIGGVTPVPITLNPFSMTDLLPSRIIMISSDLEGSNSYTTVYALGVLLFLLTLAMSIAIRIVKRKTKDGGLK